ncbi:MAG: tyrosine-type recombinase/integrase [Bacteroidales bacterium]|nr:tyrosine-type recombinase/integrase [Bacteroidales bacterium]
MAEIILQEFSDYLEYERRYSPHTIKGYITDLEILGNYLQQQTPPTGLITVGVRQIRHWLVELKTQGIESTSINRKISAMRCFYKYLIKKEIIKISPVSKLENLKTPRRLPEFVPDTAMNQLLDNEELFQNDKNGERNRMILELFYNTGIRSSELINIKCRDIDFINCTLTVKGKGNKTRIVPMSETLCSRLRKFVSISDAPLFKLSNGEPLYPRLVYKIVHQYLEQTQTVSKNSPHTLRHSFATGMLNNGADLNAIKELLGHANLSATQIYTHVTYDKLKQVYKQAHPRA